MMRLSHIPLRLATGAFILNAGFSKRNLGAMLLAPFVPSRVAGLGLAVFSGSLLTMYRRIPEMTLDDGIRPSQQGTVVAKDVWMLGIAAALILDRKPVARSSGRALGA